MKRKVWIAGLVLAATTQIGNASGWGFNRFNWNPDFNWHRGRSWGPGYRGFNWGNNPWSRWNSIPDWRGSPYGSRSYYGFNPYTFSGYNGFSFNAYPYQGYNYPPNYASQWFWWHQNEPGRYNSWNYHWVQPYGAFPPLPTPALPPVNGMGYTPGPMRTVPAVPAPVNSYQPLATPVPSTAPASIPADPTKQSHPSTAGFPPASMLGQ